MEQHEETCDESTDGPHLTKETVVQGRELPCSTEDIIYAEPSDSGISLVIWYEG